MQGRSTSGVAREGLPSLPKFLERDAKYSENKTFSSTMPVGADVALPPQPTTDFFVEDRGMSSPRFLRTTTYGIPESETLASETGIPMVLLMQPFANERNESGENIKSPDIPVVDYRSKTIFDQINQQQGTSYSNAPAAKLSGNDKKLLGPVRCDRCKAYMCAGMTFLDGGKRFKCCFCPKTSEVPDYYFSYLDTEGNRSDKYMRPELHLGAYEFMVGEAYCKDNKEPISPPGMLFMIDVSYGAIQNGLVHTVCEYLRQNLAKLLDVRTNEDGKIGKTLRVGFATYCAPEVHFYNVSCELDKPKILIVSDVGEMFVPMGGCDGKTSLMVDYMSCVENIDTLLKMIPEMYASSRTTESMLLPVVQAGMEALKFGCAGGKLFMFHSSLPRYEAAPGCLKNREDRSLIGTDKERDLLRPAAKNGQAYQSLAEECVKSAGCSVDLFLFPNQYIDIASIGQLCQITGGSCYKYAYFTAEKDAWRFRRDLGRAITKTAQLGSSAFDCVVRVRTSLGLRPTEFYGNMLMQGSQEMHVGSIDSDKSFCCEIKHDEKLQADKVFFQVAILYTHGQGERRLRILNMILPVVREHTVVFNNTCVHTLVNYWLKSSIRNVLADSSSNPAEVRKKIMNDVSKILASYRKHCDTRNTVSGQLLLPDRYTILPLLSSCLARHDVISGTGDLVSADDSSFLKLFGNCLTVEQSLWYLHPRLLSLNELLVEAVQEDATCNESDAFEHVQLPLPTRCSFDDLDPRNIYLLENCIGMFLWIGSQVDPTLLQQVFGVPSGPQLAVICNESGHGASGPGAAATYAMRAPPGVPTNNNINQSQSANVERCSDGLPRVDTRANRRLRCIIEQVRRERGSLTLRLTILVSSADPKLEPWFKRFLVEDKGPTDNQILMSYADYIVQVHYAVIELVSNM